MATSLGMVGIHLVLAAFGNGAGNGGTPRAVAVANGTSGRKVTLSGGVSAPRSSPGRRSQYSGIAQLAECRTVNPLVEGSSPSTRATHRFSQPM